MLMTLDFDVTRLLSPTNLKRIDRLVDAARHLYTESREALGDGIRYACSLMPDEIGVRSELKHVIDGRSESTQVLYPSRTLSRECLDLGREYSVIDQTSDGWQPVWLLLGGLAIIVGATGAVITQVPDIRARAADHQVIQDRGTETERRDTVQSDLERALEFLER
jgi:hypothetical protein